MKKLLLISIILVNGFAKAQVTQVSDIYPGAVSSIPAYAKNRIVHAGRIIMGANGSSVYSTQLWSSDGTVDGTALLKKISTVNTASNPQGFMYFAPTNKVYFSANNGVNSNGTNNYELWETDGTLAGTVMTKEVNTSSVNPGSYPGELVSFGNNFYFRAATGTIGTELYTSDGTGAGTVLVLDINPGGGASTPANFTVVGTKLFFTADNGTAGKELYVTNGPTAATISSFDINVGATTSGVDNLTAFNGKLYFTANNGTNGIELWQSDGTVGGTSMVMDLNAGAADSAPDDLFVYNTDLFFSATTIANGREFYKMNSANIISLVKDVNPGAPDGLTLGGANFLAYNSNLYFVANNGLNGAELWKSDGTTVNTAMLKDLNPTGNSGVINMFVFDGKMVFQATDGVSGAELFVSDGTAPGTGLAADINTGTAASSPKDFIILNNELYFTATTASAGAELWKTTTAPILGTTEFTLINNKISLYPNPSKSYFELASDITIEKVEVYSILGQLVKTFDSQNQYSTADLSKGTYVVKIKTSEGVSNKTLLME